MTFANFAKGLEKIEMVSARLEKTRLLAELFKKLDHSDVVPACYLMQGRLVPQHQSLEFQLSDKMIVRALARIQVNDPHDAVINLFGEQDKTASQTKVWNLYKKLGDLGQTAEQIARQAGLDITEKIANQVQDKTQDQTKSDAQLELTTVFERLINIATTSGTGSQDKKLEMLANLLKDLDSTSIKYIVRIVLGKMRLGFSTMTMMDALSWSVVGDKSESSVIEAAWQTKADIGKIAADYLSLAKKTPEQRKKMLAQTQLEVGVPVMPALCQRLNSTTQMIEKMNKVIVEPKYDGLRIQLHFNRGDDKAGSTSKNLGNQSGLIEVFTRSLENVTRMFPEVQQLPNILKCDSCVLDAEAVGVDPHTGKLRSFQETITRKRKYGVANQAAEVPIKFFVFDLMSLNGKSLMDLPLIERKSLLKTTFDDNSILVQVPFEVSADADFLRNYHQHVLGDGLEGAVMKKVDSHYAGGRKGWRWVKIKEVEGTTGKLNDTLDVIMMGYYQGRGKRAEFGLGAILTGILNSKGEVVTLAKIGTGMKEDQLVTLRKLADAYISSKKPDEYASINKSLKPDAWLVPKVVLEVAADEVTKSPTHGAGFALRFPRLLKIRTDKSWEQATTTEELKSIK